MNSRQPLGQITGSQLNVISHEYNKHDKKHMEQHPNVTRTQLNTPSNSPMTDSFSGSDIPIASVLNAKNSNIPFYNTPPTVLSDVHNNSMNTSVNASFEVHPTTRNAKKNPVVSEQQINKLRSRVQLAYYKYKTKQVHLKFSDIIKDQSKKHRVQKGKRQTSSDAKRKFRKLAGLTRIEESQSTTASASASASASNSSSASSQPQLKNITAGPGPDTIASRTQCITPEKNNSTKPYSSRYTPVSVKAARSLLQMFSTGA